MTAVLLVEDDGEFRRAIATNLQARGFQVRTAADGTGALATARDLPLDLVVLDLGLPDLDGVEVIRRLRGCCPAPIIVLSARSGSAEKVAALDAGADDYVTKPVGVDELAARLRALTRRSGTAPRSARHRLGPVTVDLDAKTARHDDGSTVRLTPTEWHLLEVLLARPGQLVTRRELLTEVWGYTASTQTNYLRVYLTQLRRKLEPVPGRPRYLITEPGMGYRYEPGPVPDGVEPGRAGAGPG